MCLQASSLDGTNGFTIHGRDYWDSAGLWVSSGDVNGDGYADVIVGAYKGDGSSNSASDTGEVHVVFGKASGFAASIQVSGGHGCAGELRGRGSKTQGLVLGAARGTGREGGEMQSRQ